MFYNLKLNTYYKITKLFNDLFHNLNLAKNNCTDLLIDQQITTMSLYIRTSIFALDLGSSAPFG